MVDKARRDLEEEDLLTVMSEEIESILAHTEPLTDEEKLELDELLQELYDIALDHGASNPYY